MEKFPCLANVLMNVEFSICPSPFFVFASFGNCFIFVFGPVFRGEVALVDVASKISFLNSFFELCVPQRFVFSDTASLDVNLHITSKILHD